MNFLRRYFLLIILAVLIAGNAFVWYVIFSEQRGDDMTFAVLDIGQGDSIFIEAPNGNQIIFDGGPNGKILSELSKVMPFYDRNIDAIVVTNPDKDHFAGFLDVLDRYEVGKIFEAGTKNDSAVYAEFEKAALQETDGDPTRKIIAKRGMRINLDSNPSVYIDILFPDRDVSGEKSNDGSIVARLVYGETSVMLTGDATAKVEKHLIEYGTSTLQSTILKVGHHGSKTSSSEEFVSAVSPIYAAISCGRGNKYGHPNTQTIETLEKFHTKIFRTDEMSTVIMKSDGHFFRLI